MATRGLAYDRACISLHKTTEKMAHEEELSNEVTFLSNAPVKRALIPLIYGLCL